MREQILSVKEITRAGRELIKEHYNSDMRVQTYSVRILEMHADFVDMLSDALAEKCVGNDDGATECYEKFRVEMGKRECEFALVYDHLLHTGALFNVVFSKSSEPVLLI